MNEKMDFNIDKLKKVLKKGDYYSKDLKNKSIFILRKESIDELRECFEFEDDGFGVSKEEKESGLLFANGIIRDIIMNKKYEIIEGILVEDGFQEESA